MRTINMASALLATGLAVPTLTDGSERRCTRSPDGRIVAASEITQGLEDLGYRVSRIKAKHGCYEVQAVNDSGFPIQAVYAPATGELIKAGLR
jgi:hypothetical protein